MRHIAAAGNQREYALVCLPAQPQHRVAQDALVTVLVICRNIKLLGYTGNAVEDLSGARRLDYAVGNLDDAMRSAGEEAASHLAVLAGREGRCRFVPERAR